MKKKSSSNKSAVRKELEKGAKTLRVFRIVISIFGAILSLLLCGALIYGIKAVVEGLKSWGPGA